MLLHVGMSYLAYILLILQAVMHLNVVHLVIALGSIDAAFGGVLFFEPKSSRPVNNICPDGGQCPGFDTCCMMPSGKFGCCPMPAVSAVT